MNVRFFFCLVSTNRGVLAGIRFLTFFIIFIGGVFTLISMKLYPFKGDALVKLKRDIMELHENKKVDAQSNLEN